MCEVEVMEDNIWDPLMDDEEEMDVEEEW